MNFCSVCGCAVTLRVPEADIRARYVCAGCGTIHYVNPRNIVGTLPVWHGRILLCRRAIGPRVGMWTLPAGFMELDETTAEGARRETLEESGATVDVGPLFCLANVRTIGHVYLFYLATLTSPEIAPGRESLEVRLFEERDLPWGSLAFPVVERALDLFLEDRRTGQILDGSVRLHEFDIEGTLHLD